MNVVLLLVHIMVLYLYGILIMDNVYQNCQQGVVIVVVVVVVIVMIMVMKHSSNIQSRTEITSLLYMNEKKASSQQKYVLSSGWSRITNVWFDNSEQYFQYYYILCHVRIHGIIVYHHYYYIIIKIINIHIVPHLVGLKMIYIV